MSFTSIISLFALVLGCVGSDDPLPSNKDAPDLDFSKAKWVNENVYDGVFTIRNDANNVFWADFHFNDAINKAFVPNNSIHKIENGIWFSPEIKPYFLVNHLPPNRLTGNAKLNGTWLKNYHTLNPIGTLNDISTSIAGKNGHTWEILNIQIPNNEKTKNESKLIPADAKSFTMTKEGLEVFPKAIKLEKEYRFEEGKSDKIIELTPFSDADMVYVQFTDEGFYYAGDPGPLQPHGFMKYFLPNQTSITINKSEFAFYLNGRNQVTMTLQAIKFYTHKNEAGRKFIFKNIAEAKAKIIIE